MKIIRLHAYLENNLGDDLMVKILLERYKNYRFYYNGCINNVSLEKHKNFFHKEKIYRRFGRINHLFSILTFNKKSTAVFDCAFRYIKKRSCCSVYIGGSLFFSFPGETPIHRIERERRLIDPSPLFVIGCNFNPNESDEYIQSFSDYFSSLGGVSFRDQTSYNMFKYLNNVQYANDVVWNLDDAKYKHHPKENTILISVINCDNKRIDKMHAIEYEKYISNVCQIAVDKGINPKLMSFCEVEGDEIAIQRILDNLPNHIRKKTSTYYYKGNIDEALRVFSQSRYVVATRFHAMILAMRFGIPFYAISYSEKTRQVMQDMNLNNYCDLQMIAFDNANLIWDKMVAYEDIDSCVNDSKRQFKQLNDYLKPKNEVFHDQNQCNSPRI